LSSRGTVPVAHSGPRRLQLEVLETRWALSATSGGIAVDVAAVAAQQVDPDLVAFAQALSNAGVTLFGTARCDDCTTQKDLFEDGARFLPFVDVRNPDGTLNQTGLAENIGETVPLTWKRADGTRFEGPLASLQAVSDFTGVPIPTSNQPFLAPIDDVLLLSGAPLHVPLDGYDPNGGPLTYTVASSNESLVATFMPQGNRSLKITTGSFGDMVFELFEQRAPRVTDHIIQLAESGFYNGVIFHRIVNGFVIQGGDPTGTGTGGSPLGNFDDQFHPDLQHTRTGTLSMAKASDDTNDSQFFITEGAPRSLDFNHSVFGQLVEGEAVREAVSNVPTDNGDRPVDPVVMTSVDVFRDEENRVLMLSADAGKSGEADITVTVTDQDGNAFQRTFHVTVTPDRFNGGPYLDDIPVIRGVTGGDVTFQLAGNDVEGDPVFYAGQALGDVNYSFNIDSGTGAVAITPPAGFVGSGTIGVAVRPLTRSNTGDRWDSQTVTFEVAPRAPTLDLLPSADSGRADNDNITRLRSLDVDVSGVSDGDTVRLFLSGSEVGRADTRGDRVVVTVDLPANLVDGSYDLTATTTRNEITSDASTPLNLTIDTAIGDFTTTPPARIPLGATYTYDVGNDEESATGGGVLYELATAPVGMTIDSRTGQITWPTSAADGLDQQVVVRATDLAGNVGEQAFRLILDVAPQLGPIDAQQIDEGTQRSFDVTATDANLPADALTYSLEGDVPQGAAIDPVSGRFAWTPAESQGPASYRLTVRVTDIDGLFDEKAFAIDVAEVNRPPRLDAILDRAVNPGDLVQLTANASDPDLPVQGIRFTLGAGTPEGAGIDPVTGVFTWNAPADASGPFEVTIVATDLASDPLTASQRFTLMVKPPPQITPVPDQTVREGETLRLVIEANDLQPTPPGLRYTLLPGSPAGATIDPLSGALAYTPSEAEGPSTVTIAVRVIDAIGLSATMAFDVHVQEMNRPPALAPIGTLDVTAGETVRFQAIARDNDLPRQRITFRIDPGQPAGATIDAETGQFSWSTGEGTVGTFLVTVRATDTGDPALSTSEQVRIRVAGRIADAGFGIALAMRSRQIESLATPPVRRLEVPVFANRVPAQALRRLMPPLVNRLAPEIALGQRELRQAGSGGGDVAVQRKSLRPRHQDDKVTPATAIEAVPKDPQDKQRSRRGALPGDASGEKPGGNHKGAAATAVDRAVDRAIVELLFDPSE